MLKTFPSDKVNVTKNAPIFLSRASVHHSFTFNSRFLYVLKHKVYLSIFDSVLFLLEFIFFLIKNMDYLTLNVIIPFKIKIMEKPHTVLLPEL